ncbi:MAG: hypothetical protein WCY01_01640 [Alkalispirochaeta sp.]|jgi:hypothetical protein
MNIRINGVEIDFQLEDESTAGDVFSGISRWLRESGHRVESVSLNGTAIHDLDDLDGSWRKQSVTDVKDLDILAESVMERRVNDFETIIHYTELLRRVMDEGTSEQREAVLEELPHILEGIRRNAPDLAGLLDEPIQGGSHGDPEIREKIARRAGDMATLLEQRQRELLDPEHEMGSTIAALDVLLPTFEEIPGELQDGNRKKALETVSRFSELVARELRILPVLLVMKPDLQNELVDGVSLNEAIESLNGLFREMEGAFTNNDFVLIGDLLEYEMLPRFTELHSTVLRHIG